MSESLGNHNREPFTARMRRLGKHALVVAGIIGGAVLAF